MTLAKFTTSVFGNVITANDLDVIIWANNVYDKIKGFTILPKFIKKESGVKRVNLINYTGGSVVKNDSFTFGYCKTGSTALDLEYEVNIGKIHTIEYEITEEGLGSGYLLDNMVGYPNVVISGLGFAKVRIERVNTSVQVFVNDVLQGNYTLPANNDLIFDNILGGSYTAGNIKITRNDKILNWWKLNSYFDEGINSEDFYTFWYSVCYFFALVNKYVKVVIDFSSNVFKERFIRSRGVYYSHDLIQEDVDYIFENWLASIANRGTEKISYLKGGVDGLCLDIATGLGSSKFELYEDYELGNSYLITFDLEITGKAATGGLLSHINNLASSGSQNLVSFISGGIRIYNVDFPLSNGFYSISILRVGSLYFVDINGVRVYSASNLGTGSDIIRTITTGSTDKVGNIIIHSKFDEHSVHTLRIPCDEDEFYLKEGSGNYIARFNNPSVFAGLQTSNIRSISDNFKKGTQRDISGEMSRLINRSDMDEYVLALSRDVDWGWNLNNTSPMSRQSYPIINANKFANKTSNIYELSGINPICNTASGFFTDNMVIDDETFTEEKVLKITVPAGGEGGFNKPSQTIGISSFISRFLVINTELDYEFSFKVFVLNNSSLNLNFGVNAKNNSGTAINLLNAVNGAASSSFVSNFNIGLSQTYAGKWIWFRGMILKESVDPNVKFTGLNLGIQTANHLIFAPNTAQIMPYIHLVSGGAGNTVFIKDIQFRPVVLPIQRGVLGVKNVVVPYLSNKGDFSMREVTDIMVNELLPYNTILTKPFRITSEEDLVLSKPSQPTLLVAVAVSSSQIDLKWNPPYTDGGSEITSYNVYMWDGSIFSYIGETIGDNREFEVINLQPATTYYFVVTAINVEGESHDSNVASATTFELGEVPKEPTVLEATAINHKQIDLNWVAPADEDPLFPVIGYRIRRRLGDTGSWVVIVTNTGNTDVIYEDIGLLKDTKYCYQVAAINIKGVSVYSNIACATTFDAFVPNTPSLLEAEAISSTEINLTWEIVHDPLVDLPILFYEIHVQEENEFVLFGQTEGNVLEFLAQELEPDTIYCFKVRAKNEIGFSDFSNIACAKTFPPESVSDMPIGLVAVAFSSTEIDLTWVAPIYNGGTEITQYIIYMLMGLEFMEIARVNGTTLTYRVGGLQPSTTYMFRVAAVNAVGISEMSSIAWARTFDDENRFIQLEEQTQ